MIRPRHIAMRLHLWLGLSLGAVLVLAGLTGSVLVFYVEIDALLHPQQASQGTANAASYDAAIPALRKAFPDKHGPWRIEVTGKAGAIPVRYYNPTETAGRAFAPMMVWLSADGTRVLRRDYWGDYAMTWIYDLHYRLQLGKLGGVLFGYAGLAILVLLISGLLSWWPRGSIAKALRFKRRASASRRLRDIHKLAGLTSLPLLIMFTLTGVMLALPEESNAVLAPVFGTVQPMPLPVSRALNGPQISPATAIAAAKAAIPAARLAWIEVPAPGDGAYRLRMQQAGDPSRRFPHSFVWIDQHDGTVLASQDSASFPALSVINKWLHPLHDGSAGGIVLRIVAAMAGLLPAELFVTGLVRWKNRRRPRQSVAISARRTSPRSRR